MDDVAAKRAKWEFPFMLSYKELQIITTSLQLLTKEQEKILTEDGGNVGALYQKLVYPLTEGVTVNKVARDRVGKDMDLL